MGLLEFRVAILQNYSSSAEGGELMIEKISKLVYSSKPDAFIKVYAPIDGDPFPDLNVYDLIILSGGPFNLLEDKKPPWVTETFDFIRTFATGRVKPKLLGICWGQQAIALAFGGAMGELEGGPCIGVETLPLTSTGASFFNTGSLNIHKNHTFVVTDIAPHLSSLAPNNEIILSKDNLILAFQGHPELDAALSQLFIEINGLSPSARPGLESAIKPVDAPHDGELIFATVMKWASGDIDP